MIRATFTKELQLFFADRAGMAATFLMPVVFIIGFGMMFKSNGDGGRDLSLPSARIAVHYSDGHEEAEEIAKWIDTSESLEVERVEDVEALRAAVADGTYRAGLIIPRDYRPKDRLAELCIDTAQPKLERLAVEGPLRGALATFKARKFTPSISNPSGVEEHFKFWEVAPPPGARKAIKDIDSFQVSVPGNAVLFCFFLALSVAMSFYEERKKGTWRRLLAAPGRRWTMLVAKLLPVSVIGLLQMSVLFALGHFAFGMRVGGSVFALAGITVAVVFAACSLGLLIASFGGTEKQISGYSTIAILGMGLIGGCMFPRMFMPESVKVFGTFVPHGHALDAYYDVLVRDGTTLADVAGPVMIIFGFGALFSIVAACVFRFEK